MPQNIQKSNEEAVKSPEVNQKENPTSSTENVIPTSKPETPVIQKCSDGTLYSQCSVNKPSYCESGNLINKCFACGCPSGQQCQTNGSCQIIQAACQNECSQVGLKGCSENSYQMCGNYDNDACLEWGPVISCSAGTTCVMGNCIAIVSPKNEVEYWAVISGAPGGTGKPTEYGYLPVVLKDILIRHGWKEDHIKYFTKENATYANVVTALDWLANNTAPNDVVLFYSMSHGSSDGIYLNDDRYLGFSELAEKLDKIRYDGMTIIIDACYSGGARPILQKENRVIITTARADEMGMNAVFSQRLLAALQGFGDIDGNNNGWVSLEEAFNFAKKGYSYDSSPNPQIKDDYPGELETVFLDGYWQYLDQYNIGGTGGNRRYTGKDYIGGDPSNDEIRWSAQSFKPSFPVLTNAMLGVSFGEGNPGPLIVSVRKDLSGSDLTSATLNQDTIRPFSSELYEFDFPDIEVIPNETYYLVIRAPSVVKKTDFYYIWIDTEGEYSKGGMVGLQTKPSIPWYEIYGMDFLFATFGKPK